MNTDKTPGSIEILQDFTWVSEPVPWPLWVWVSIFSLIFLLIVGVAWYFFIFRQKTRKTIEAAPQIPAHVTAQLALRRLGESMDGMSELDFVIEVSRILRVYLQERFKLRAPHRATEEFLWEASESAQFSEDQQQLLGKFLSRCDMIKFAQRRHVAVEKMKELLGTTQAFVESTTDTPGLQQKSPAQISSSVVISNKAGSTQPKAAAPPKAAQSAAPSASRPPSASPSPSPS
ncbi:MAG: hypothetical protein ACAI35_23275 [Candidatus Methylacidiphilales bacterium]|nr:hypothetical protein [Candidatus Methylacidiphilales bacterium]